MMTILFLQNIRMLQKKPSNRHEFFKGDSASWSLRAKPLSINMLSASDMGMLQMSIVVLGQQIFDICKKKVRKVRFLGLSRRHNTPKQLKNTPKGAPQKAERSETECGLERNQIPLKRRKTKYIVYTII